MYNKQREINTGKPYIKISREYKFLFFQYIGYKNVQEFLQKNTFSQIQQTTQLDLIISENKNEEYYYVAYYFGEDRQVIKGELTIFNDWKTIEIKFIYDNKNGAKSVYTFFGSIKISEGFAFFDTKYFDKNSKKEGAKYTFFIGKSSPNERILLRGTYCGFDKYDRAIAGIMILKKVNTKVDLEEEVANLAFDPIICQELNKCRFIVPSQIHKNLFLLSQKSPYAELYLNTAGYYLAKFILAKMEYSFEFEIQKYHFNLISTDKSIVIKDDQIKLINKGQILYLDFSLIGIFFFQKMSIYIPFYFLKEGERKTCGKFIGITIHNDIVSGTTELNKIECY